jgi:hypothetical protein
MPQNARNDSTEHNNDDLRWYVRMCRTELSALKVADFDEQLCALATSSSTDELTRDDMLAYTNPLKSVADSHYLPPRASIAFEVSNLTFSDTF